MPKIAKELSALQVNRLQTPGFHAVGGVVGLMLQVTSTGARSWVLRWMVDGTRRDMGLGSFPTVTLAMAREAAREARAVISKGADPIEDRRALRSSIRASVANAKTFEQCAREYVEYKSVEWQNDKHRLQWLRTLEEYAFPGFGKQLVGEVERSHVLAALQPIWTTKTETATRVRGRVEAVLDWASVSGYRSADNPARWKGNLEKLLPTPSKVAKVKHHAALPVDAMAPFMAKLKIEEGMGARALEFAIFTASRSGEVRGARWTEIDLKAALWIVPGERMKAGKEHRVPLSKQSIGILARLPRLEKCPFVFFSPRGLMLSDMTLSAVLRRMQVPAVPHGFRSTFRDWAAERTNHPSEVAEMSLAHAIGDKVEAAYRRGDLFEKRRAIMHDWAKFITKRVRA